MRCAAINTGGSFFLVWRTYRRMFFCVRRIKYRTQNFVVGGVKYEEKHRYWRCQTQEAKQHSKEVPLLTQELLLKTREVR